jgi:hypothetical protein
MRSIVNMFSMKRNARRRLNRSLNPWTFIRRRGDVDELNWSWLIVSGM